MKTNTVFIACLLFLFCGCKRHQENTYSEKEYAETEKALVGANRLILKKDKENIMAYINQHKLDMKESGTGLWYRIDKSGHGKIASNGQQITLKYKVSLLNGTPCYSSDSLGPKKFIVGKGGVESGLEEGVAMLGEGDRAIFIMPPHLADGLPGDGNKIPAHSIIIYEVEVLKLEPQ
jgi:FKBP-type peptidyl-prolyl cis-trans isomerase FkpA